MDFFASQELARRNTRKLFFLLAGTVILLILAIYLIVVALFGVAVTQSEEIGSLAPTTFFSVENGLLLAGVAFAVLAVVTIGSTMKTAELRQGGRVVADMLGGRRISQQTTDFSERRILNIVEEMSLASGVPVPPVYVMENEPGINAFAAGHTIDDAVIGVNRGTIETLNREELQGVIAHEFSHILNGDMRMSLRMIGLLYGIQAIALIGMYMFRIAGHMSGGRSRSNDKGNPAIALFILGLALFLFGSVGLLCARLIKASISRQREYLADASAVQFTRLPDGIAGALKMIGANSASSRVQAADAESISHMFFANMYGSKIQSFFATHPPLVPRIKRIEPRFAGNFQDYLRTRSKASIIDREKEEEEHQRHLAFGRRFGMMMGRMESAMGTSTMPSIPIAGFPIDPALMVAAIGSPSNDDVTYTQILLKNLPESFLNRCRDLFTARCIVFASLLSDNAQIQQRQFEILDHREAKGTWPETERAKQELAAMDPRFRLPIFEILQGTLVGLSQSQLEHFEKTLHHLIMADGHVDLFEFFLLHHLVVHLRRHLGIGAKPQVKFESLKQLKPEVELVMSVVAKQSGGSPTEVVETFQAGSVHLPQLADQIQFANTDWDHEPMFAAVTKLSQASPAAKKEFLTALGVMIVHDQHITVEEAELFRAIAESLDCPVPPIMASQ